MTTQTADGRRTEAMREWLRKPWTGTDHHDPKCAGFEAGWDAALRTAPPAPIDDAVIELIACKVSLLTPLLFGEEELIMETIRAAIKEGR